MGSACPEKGVTSRATLQTHHRFSDVRLDPTRWDFRYKACIRMPEKHRIFTTSVAKVYPYYVEKAEKKGRTKSEVDSIICWLTGYNQRQLERELKKQTDFETFFGKAPKPNPLRSSIKGVICGVRVEEIKEPTMREIRYLDKLIDELAKGKPMEKILRT
jgi:hypothetical protein